MTPILVLGIGNILLKDEGVGVHIVRAIEGAGVPDDVELCDGGTFGLDLVDTIAGRRKVVIVDAVQADAEPATVLRFTDKDLVRRETADLSLHQMGLLETLEMARQLGCAPGEVVIFGIVPKDMNPGLELSDEVFSVVPKVVKLVLEELRR